MADPPLLEVIDDINDNDSAIGTEDQVDVSSTTSIGSSILRYRKVNGRTYHAYKEGKYLLPNEEGENDRLDLQHHMYYLILNDKLYIAPIPKEQKLDRVLDLGTGTGIWAVDFAVAQDSHATSKFPWLPQWRFLLILARNINPGGWLEVKDIKFPIEDNDNSFPEDCAIQRWTDLVLEGTIKLGRSANSAQDYKVQLIEAGFENVVAVQYKWPQNRWPKDRKLKELGTWMLENFSEGLSGLSMAVFTRGLGWTQEELEVFLIEVRKSMKDPNIHGYYPIYVVYGQKPDKIPR